MLNTLTYAAFEHNGCRAAANRMVDTESGKFFGWHGAINARDDFSIVAKSIKQFEEKFIRLVDEKKAEITNDL